MSNAPIQKNKITVYLECQPFEMHFLGQPAIAQTSVDGGVLVLSIYDRVDGAMELGQFTKWIGWKTSPVPYLES